MKGRIIINAKARIAYIPEIYVNSGFVGNVDIEATPAALIIIKPHASLQDIHQSLKLAMTSIELQMKQEMKQGW